MVAARYSRSLSKTPYLNSLAFRNREIFDRQQNLRSRGGRCRNSPARPVKAALAESRRAFAKHFSNNAVAFPGLPDLPSASDRRSAWSSLLDSEIAPAAI